MSWQAASFVVLALGPGRRLRLVRARQAARARARARGHAGRARRGRPARLRGGPERQADHRHRAVRRLRARRGAGLRGRRGHGARLERLPLAGPVDAVADGRLGGRRRGRRAARARAARPRARAAAAGRGLRPGRPRLRRLDGPLPAHPRGPPGPRHLSRALGQLAPLQPRPRDRKRGVLPLDRTRLHPRPAPLPPPLRGALARARGRGRGDAAAACCWRCRPRAGAASPAERAERWLLRAQNDDGGFGPAPGQASSALYSGWAGLGLAAAGHNPRDLRRPGGRIARRLRGTRRAARSGTSARSSGRSCCSRRPGCRARDFAGRDLVAADQAPPPRPTARSPAT